MAAARFTRFRKSLSIGQPPATIKKQHSETLDEAFWLAVLLTGTVDNAEAAVLDGIANLQPEDISGTRLLIEVVKSAIRQHDDLPDQRDRTLLILPVELRRVALLPANLRHCFVLRVLLGMNRETCSELLHLSVPAVEQALRMGMEALPFVR